MNKDIPSKILQLNEWSANLNEKQELSKFTLNPSFVQHSIQPVDYSLTIKEKFQASDAIQEAAG